SCRVGRRDHHVLLHRRRLRWQCEPGRAVDFDDHARSLGRAREHSGLSTRRHMLKRTSPARLIEAIHEARSGGSPMSPEIARKVIVAFQKQPPATPLDAKLSEQDLRLLALLAAGHSYSQAGDELGITINTVRNHVRRVYEKLQVKSKSAAVMKVSRA